MNPFKEALDTKSSNEKFESLLSAYRMNDELRYREINELLNAIEDGTRVVIKTEGRDFGWECGWSTNEDQKNQFKSQISDRATSWVKIYRKGKNVLTLERINSRYQITSI